MTKLSLFLSALALVWCGQAWFGGEASAAPRCKRIKGEIVLTPVSGPECNSAVSICGAGKLSGSLEGTSFFVGSSLGQTVDTPSTSVVLLTGDNRIETRRGALLT